MIYRHGITKDVFFQMLTAGVPDTGLTGITIQASKGGGSFTAISATVTEVGRGWYKYPDTHATQGKGIVNAWKGSSRGSAEYQVIPPVEIIQECTLLKDSVDPIPFQLFDSDGHSVDGALTSGGFTTAYAFNNTGFSQGVAGGSLSPLSAYNGTHHGGYVYPNPNADLTYLKGVVLLCIYSSAIDARATVRINVI